MKKPDSKYILYIALLVIAAIAVIYSSVALIMHGSPMLKSMREHVKSANEFHRDSLYDKAIEPYRRAMDMDPQTIKAVWGFNGTERPGAVYLASVLASHAQKGIPAFGIYGKYE